MALTAGLCVSTLPQAIVRGLLGLHESKHVLEFEMRHNKRFWPPGVTTTSTDQLLRPWIAGPADIMALNEVLLKLWRQLPTRVAGKPVVHLLDIKRKKRMAHYTLMAGPIGE
jgi:hypothetical protein